MREEVQKLLFLLRRGGKVTHTGDPSLPIEGLAICLLRPGPRGGGAAGRPSRAGRGRRGRGDRKSVV